MRAKFSIKSLGSPESSEFSRLISFDQFLGFFRGTLHDYELAFWFSGALMLAVSVPWIPLIYKKKETTLLTCARAGNSGIFRNRTNAMCGTADTSPHCASWTVWMIRDSRMPRTWGFPYDKLRLFLPDIQYSQHRYLWWKFFIYHLWNFEINSGIVNIDKLSLFRSIDREVFLRQKRAWGQWTIGRREPYTNVTLQHFERK